MLGSAALAAERIALVIGNAAYDGAPLENPINDAKAVAQALRSLGFTVVLLLDADKKQMERAVTEVREGLKGRDAVGLLYYAGHAIQLEWRNYLVPVDARLSRPRDVATQTVDLQRILDAFRDAGNRMNIVVLDACRDNPFGATGRGLGLAPLDAPRGTYLAYATAPGNVAEDGASEAGHSLFTAQFVKELRRPDSRIEDVFKRVRLQVRQRTAGRQIPWDSSSLEDEFYFDRGLQSGAGDSRSREREFALEKAEWDRISRSDDPKDFFAYLEKYPSGLISELAQSRLDALNKARLPEQPRRDGAPAGDRRDHIRDGDRFWYWTTNGLTNAFTGHGFLRIEVQGDEISEVWGRGGSMVSVRTNLSGFTIEDESGRYDPPYPSVPGGVLQVGKRFTSRSILKPWTGASQWVDFDAQIVGIESVTVPTGTVQAYKVELRGQRQDGGRLTRTAWFEPGWYAPIKVIQETRVGWRVESYVRELTGRERRD